jgi:hypothetical protein
VIRHGNGEFLLLLSNFFTSELLSISLQVIAHRKMGHNRMATMFDSPYHEYSHVKFTIGEDGIQDLEKKGSKALAGNSEFGW